MRLLKNLFIRKKTNTKQVPVQNEGENIFHTEQIMELDTKKKIYSDFNATKKSEEKSVFDLEGSIEGLMRDGYDNVSAVAWSIRVWKESPEYNKFHNEILKRIATKYNIKKDVLEKLIEEGKKEGWD